MNLITKNFKAILIRLFQLTASCILLSLLLTAVRYADILSYKLLALVYLLLEILFVLYNFRACRRCCIEGLYLKNFYTTNIASYVLFSLLTYGIYFACIPLGEMLHAEDFFMYFGYVVSPVYLLCHARLPISMPLAVGIFHVSVLTILCLAPVGLTRRLHEQQTAREYYKYETESRKSL